MILELNKKNILITPMVIPEPASYFYIQYKYEPNTSHLMPRLVLDGREYIGDRIHIDLTDAMKTKNIKLTVELLNGQLDVLYKYTTTILHTNYSVFGPTPVRPDLHTHMRQLEQELEQIKIRHEEEKSVLRQRITELEEQGEVI